SMRASNATRTYNAGAAANRRHCARNVGDLCSIDSTLLCSSRGSWMLRGNPSTYLAAAPAMPEPASLSSDRADVRELATRRMNTTIRTLHAINAIAAEQDRVRSSDAPPRTPDSRRIRERLSRSCVVEDCCFAGRRADKRQLRSRRATAMSDREAALLHFLWL